ncbi:uncharacterized protein MONBRDRAFT_33830 [Monosiga brevicollis MX1]|uniref:CBM21 domain-containing protein n=1 Tax=Monosiga brevicollis TaxID=81824 RepID=A9V7T7_MONBE|nr:uncharacterized protein MONBRDRAFT_33830 [Monosiga brevicollis MX1]EDQ86434.1 predicted protein [Monosiga brevicollis MX1]|eukprot:XP_001748824.1 hypothetical protein [Monosiga brevicollis MX1]
MAGPVGAIADATAGSQTVFDDRALSPMATPTSRLHLSQQTFFQAQSPTRHPHQRQQSPAALTKRNPPMAFNVASEFASDLTDTSSSEASDSEEDYGSVFAFPHPPTPMRKAPPAALNLPEPVPEDEVPSSSPIPSPESTAASLSEAVIDGAFATVLAAEANASPTSPKVHNVIEKLPVQHPARVTMRRLSDGSLYPHQPDYGPIPGPKPRQTKIMWRDSTGQKLCSSIFFRKNEPPCRCRPSSVAPSPVPLQTPSFLIKSKPAMTFDVQQLPAGNVAVVHSLASKAVQLEQVTLRYPLAFLTVRVLNMAFEKRVFIRWSTDGWKTTKEDVVMTYLPSCADPSSDRFYATLKLDSDEIDRIEFCVGYNTTGQCFWDNRDGQNYAIVLKHHATRFGRC